MWDHIARMRIKAHKISEQEIGNQIENEPIQTRLLTTGVMN
jgi:hypothetical protein